MASTAPPKFPVIQSFSLQPLQWEKIEPARARESSEGENETARTRKLKDFEEPEARAKALQELNDEMEIEEGEIVEDVDEDDTEDEEDITIASAEATVADEVVHKTWNLRPRKPQNKNNINEEQSKPLNNNETQTLSKPRASQSVKRPRLSISLTKKVIEADFKAMTGSKPSKKPKKRARVVQKTLDNIFPGLWLGSITRDTYKVNENKA